MKRKIGRGLAAMAVLAAAACSNETSSSYAMLGPALKTVLNRGAPSAAGGFEATDAQLRAFPDPLIVVETEATGSTAGLLLQQRNRDTEVWASQDGVTLSLRGGQLNGSRGLGNDLLSVEAPDIRRGGARLWRERYELGGDEQVRRSRYDCRLADGGRPTLSVAGQARPVRLVIENCTAAVTGAIPASFENRYWIEEGGVIRKSRQYLTPAHGHLVITRING